MTDAQNLPAPVLAACPFCEASTRDDFGPVFGQSRSAFFVHCARCGAEGPDDKYQPTAGDKWNRRSLRAERDAVNIISTINPRKQFPKLGIALRDPSGNIVSMTYTKDDHAKLSFIQDGKVWTIEAMIDPKLDDRIALERRI